MIEWKHEGHRIVALSGMVEVAYVFPRSGKAKPQIRILFGASNPFNVKATNEEAGKAEVESRYRTFLADSGLMPAAPALALARRTIEYVGAEETGEQMDCDREMRALAKTVMSLFPSSNEDAKRDEGGARR